MRHYLIKYALNLHAFLEQKSEQWMKSGSKFVSFFDILESKGFTERILDLTPKYCQQPKINTSSPFSKCHWRAHNHYIFITVISKLKLILTNYESF